MLANQVKRHKNKIGLITGDKRTLDIILLPPFGKLFQDIYNLLEHYIIIEVYFIFIADH